MQSMKDQLVNVFSKRTVLTIEDLKNILETTSRMTIFRKLKQLSYKTSYSHCGKYYSLESLAQYNEYGIWDYNHIYFSKYGTLKNCVLKVIEKSKTGLTSFELGELLHVSVYNTVLNCIPSKKEGKHIICDPLKLSRHVDNF